MYQIQPVGKPTLWFLSPCTVELSGVSTRACKSITQVEALDGGTEVGLVKERHWACEAVEKTYQ